MNLYEHLIYQNRLKLFVFVELATYNIAYCGIEHYLYRQSTLSCYRPQYLLIDAWLIFHH